MRRFLTLMSSTSLVLAISAAPALAYPNKPHPGAVAGHSGTALTGADITVMAALLGALLLIAAASLAFGVFSGRRAVPGR